MKIKPKNVTVENFSKFGSAVIPGSAAPTSEAINYKFWSDAAHYFIDGETEIGICTAYKQPAVFISSLERHKNTPEILIPIDTPFILPVLAVNDSDDKAEAFRVRPGEAVVMDNSVWHGACIPVGKNSATYFVIFKRKTPFEDMEFKDVAEFEVEA